MQSALNAGVVEAWFYQYDAEQDHFNKETAEAILFDFCKGYFDAYALPPVEDTIINEIEANQDLPNHVIHQVVELVRELRSVSVNESEFFFCLDKVKEEYLRGLSLSAAQGYLERLKDNPVKAASFMQSQLASIQANAFSSDDVDGKSVWLSDFAAHYRNRLSTEGMTTFQAKAIPYPYPQWNSRLGGMSRGEVGVLAAKHAAGKSFIIHDLAYNAASLGFKVVVAELEMLFDQLFLRYAARLCGLPIDKIKRGMLSKGEQRLLDAALEEVEALADKGNLLIVPPNLCRTPQRLQREIETHFGNIKPDLIGIDYLTEMRPSRGRYEGWENTLALIQEVKHDLAIANNAHAVTVIHLNKQNEVQYQSVNQRADLVIKLTPDPDDAYVPPDEDEWIGKPGTVNAYVSRNRNGPQDFGMNLTVEYATASINQASALGTAVGRSVARPFSHDVAPQEPDDEVDYADGREA